MNYSDNYYRLSQRFPEVPRLTPAHYEAMAMFNELAKCARPAHARCVDCTAEMALQYRQLACACPVALCGVLGRSAGGWCFAVCEWGERC